MIIRGAIAAPFALGVFSSLMLIPGNMGFVASGLCYVLMMAAIAANVPSFLRRYGDYESASDEGSDSLFAALLGKAQGVAPFAMALPTKARELLAWTKAHLPFVRHAEEEPEPVEQDVPDAIAVLNELKEEFAAEEGGTGDGETDEDDDPANDDLADEPAAAEEDAEDLEAEPAGRFAFFKRLLARAAKLPGIAYLLSLTVKLEVKRNQDETDNVLDDEPQFTGAVEPLDDEEPIADVDEDFVDIDAITLSDRPSLADRLLRRGAPLLALVAPIMALLDRLRRRPPESADQELDRDSFDALPDGMKPTAAVTATLKSSMSDRAKQLALVTLRVVSWVLLMIVVLPVLLADLAITALRNRLAGHAQEKRPTEEAVEVAPAPRRVRETTPASLYAEYPDAA